jgi:transposase/DNA-binding CsgD family transcriptional regulator
MRVAKAVVLTDEERVVLERWARGRSTPARLVQRARIVLAAAQGKRNDKIAAELACTRRTAGVWRNRFIAKRLAGIEKDALRPGRTPTITPQLTQAIIDKTTREKPPAATHWSTRTLARAMGINQTAVSRVWRTHQLKPHLTKTFKVSNDKRFVEKTIDIVGLYLNPPERAIVLSVDEKSQIQALDRTQRSLPMYPGRKGTLTHDYKRNGTTTLFAALNVLDGTVLGRCMQRHRHQEFLRFLNTIERAVPAGKVIHVILDNYATHKHPKVLAWLARHPRWTFHFTPTSGSWLNAVETFFSTLTRRRLKRGVFRSILDLQAAIHRYLAEHNDDPKPFTWTKTAAQILAKLNPPNAPVH